MAHRRIRTSNTPETYPEQKLDDDLCQAVYRVMGEYTKGVYPVSTGLVVQALARPEWVVEIDATAVIPDARVA